VICCFFKEEKVMNKAVKGLVVVLAAAVSSMAFAQQNAPQAPQTGAQAPAGQFAGAPVGPGYYGAPVGPAYYGPGPYAYGPYYGPYGGPGYWGGPYGYGGGRGHGSGHMSFSMSGSGWGNGNNGWW
jgi:hypothetical protein